MLRIEKGIRHFIAGLVILMSFLYGMALMKPNMKLKAIHMPDFSQTAARIDELFANRLAEKKETGEFSERVQDSGNRILQVYEYIFDQKNK